MSPARIAGHDSPPSLAARSRRPRRPVVDPGWPFILAGLVMLGAWIVLPTSRQAAQLEAERDALARQTDAARELAATHRRTIEALAIPEQDVLDRLEIAASGRLPDGERMAVDDPPASKELASLAVPFDGVEPADPSSALTPPSRLEQLVTGPGRLWIAAGSVFSIFIGLVLGPTSRIEDDPVPSRRADVAWAGPSGRHRRPAFRSDRPRRVTVTAKRAAAAVTQPEVAPAADIVLGGSDQALDAAEAPNVTNSDEVRAVIETPDHEATDEVATTESPDEACGHAEEWEYEDAEDSTADATEEATDTDGDDDDDEEWEYEDAEDSTDDSAEEATDTADAEDEEWEHEDAEDSTDDDVEEATDTTADEDEEWENEDPEDSTDDAVEEATDSDADDEEWEYEDAEDSNDDAVEEATDSDADADDDEEWVYEDAEDSTDDDAVEEATDTASDDGDDDDEEWEYEDAQDSADDAAEESTDTESAPMPQTGSSLRTTETASDRAVTLGSDSNPGIDAPKSDPPDVEIEIDVDAETLSGSPAATSFDDQPSDDPAPESAEEDEWEYEYTYEYEYVDASEDDLPDPNEASTDNDSETTDAAPDPSWECVDEDAAATDQPATPGDPEEPQPR